MSMRMMFALLAFLAGLAAEYVASNSVTRGHIDISAGFPGSLAPED